MSTALASPAKHTRRRLAEDRIAELAIAQHGVVTRAQLIAAGLTAGSIRGRVDGGRLGLLYRGVYGVGPLLPSGSRLVAAAFACGPQAVISHRTAASLFGLLPDRPGAPIDVTVPRPHDRARPGIRVHRAQRLEAPERTIHDGFPVTTIARTIVDLAAVCVDDELERAIARAERDGLITMPDLTALPERYRGRRAMPRLRALLDRMGGPCLTRSEAEARFLRLVRRARLPMPRANAQVGAYEIDFLWPDHGVAVEIDGYRYHGSRARFESDRQRAAHLAAGGLQVVPLTWRQVVDDEMATAVQLGQVLARAGARRTGPAG